MRTLCLVRIGTLILCSVLPMVVMATPPSLTYQGRILKADGAPLNSGTISFLFEITNPSGSCVIYREQVHGISMNNSGGVFDVSVGAGAQSYPDIVTNPSFTILSSFENGKNFICDGGVIYTAGQSDVRKLRVHFRDETGWKLITPDNVIRAVPYAAQAMMSTTAKNAEALGNHPLADFVLKSALQNCSPGQYLTYDGANFSCQTDAGGAGMVSDVNVTAPLTKGGTTSIPVLGINVGTVAGSVAAGDDSRFTNARVPTGPAGGDLGGTYPSPFIAKIQSVPVSNAVPTIGDYLKYDGSQWMSAVIGIGDVANLSSTLNGYLLKSTFDGYVSSAGCLPHQTMYWSAIFGFQCQSINVSVAGDVSGSIGATYVNKIKGVDVDTTGLTSGQILKYNGGKWTPADDNNSGGTVTNIATGTGLSGGPINSTGTISLADTTVTPGSYARANITVDAQGRLTAASNGSAINLASDITGVLPIANGGTGQATSLAAFNALSPLTSKGDILTRDGANNIRFPVGLDGQVLTVNSGQASGLEWITPKNGTVTSVTGATPIVVSNGTTIPTISISDATTGAKGAVQVGAGIEVMSGVISADPASFPSLVPINKGGTGVSTFTANRIVASDGTGSTLTTFNCPIGRLVTFDSTGMMTCSSFATGTVFLNGGNSFSGDASFGLNDGYNLDIKTNSLPRMTITSTGQVGIGTTTPGSPLTVNGIVQSTTGGFKFPDGSIQTTALASTGGPVIRTGSFISPGSAGNYSVTGLGMTPQYVRFWVQYNRSGSSGAVSVSVCTGGMTATSQWAYYSYYNYNNNPARNYIYNDRVFICSSADSSFSEINATFVSLDANGFTINFSQPNAAYTILYEATGVSTTASAGSGTTNYIPMWLSSTALGNSPVAVSGTNVGIGTASPASKLDVAGEVKFGNTSSACNSTNEGQQRYNGGSRIMEFCNGSSWTAMGGGGGVPAGTVEAMLTASCPSGYVAANGAAISRTTYSSLFAAISTMYGAGDGTTTFNVPDLRGYFLRGWNNGAGNDPDAASRTNRGDGVTGDAVGTKQLDQIKSHNHYSVSAGNLNHRVGITGGPNDAWFADGGDGGYTTSYTGGSESRPKNINVLYCIKY